MNIENDDESDESYEEYDNDLENKMDHFKQIFENYQSIRSLYLKKNKLGDRVPEESINSSKRIAEGLESARKL